MHYRTVAFFEPQDYRTTKPIQNIWHILAHFGTCHQHHFLIRAIRAHNSCFKHQTPNPKHFDKPADKKIDLPSER